MVVVEEGTIRTKSRVEERTVNVKSVSIRLEPWQNISWKMFRDKNSTFLRYDRFKSIIIYLIKFVLPSESLLPCFTDRVNFWRRRKILPRNRQQPRNDLFTITAVRPPIIYETGLRIRPVVAPGCEHTAR